MPELINIVFFYFLANIGGTVAYFRFHRIGWAYWSDPIVTGFYFVTIGIVWSAITKLLDWLYR